MFHQLVLQRETFTTLLAGQGLDPVCWVEPGEMSIEVERRAEALLAEAAPILGASVTEGVLLQRAGILE